MSSTGFTIDHLPYGVITTPDDNIPHLATAYEGYAINLTTLASQGFLKEDQNSAILADALSVSK